MGRSLVMFGGVILWVVMFFASDFATAQVIWDRSQIDRIRQKNPVGYTPQGKAFALSLIHI